MAKEFKIVNVINGVPTFEVPIDKVWEGCVKGGAYRRVDPIEFITNRQRRWYKGVCLPQLAKNDENGETTGWWDDEVKRKCKGLAYLKKEIFFTVDEAGKKIGTGRLTTKGVGIKNMTAFIEEILSVSMVMGWPVSPPDPELRK